jgi:hypothetical protein
MLGKWDSRLRGNDGLKANEANWQLVVPAKAGTPFRF